VLFDTGAMRQFRWPNDPSALEAPITAVTIVHRTISSPSALIDALKTLIAIGFAFAENTRVLHTSK